MAIISFRYNDDKKNQAETIANTIGLPLSKVMTVLLNRFVSEQGFPFDLKVEKPNKPFFESDELEKKVEQAILNCDKAQNLPNSAYLDDDGVFHPSIKR